MIQKRLAKAYKWGPTN